jgi:hypothetical protein
VGGCGQRVDIQRVHSVSVDQLGRHRVDALGRRRASTIDEEPVIPRQAFELIS